MEYILEQQYLYSLIPCLLSYDLWCGSYCADTTIVDTPMVQDYDYDHDFHYDPSLVDNNEPCGEDAIYNPTKPKSSNAALHINALRSIPSGLFSSSILDDSEFFVSTVDSTLHARPPFTRVTSNDTDTTATMRTTSFDDDDDEDWDDDYNQVDSDSAFFGSSYSAAILVRQDYFLPLIQEEETIPTSPISDKCEFEFPIKTTSAPSSPASLSWKPLIKQLFEPSPEDTSPSDLSLYRDAATSATE